jgi:hypothetical protein
MSQSNYNIPNQSAPAVRAQLNAVFGSIATNNSGSTAPSTTFAYQWWYDTSTDILKQRNAANSAWINIGTFDQSGGTFTPAGQRDLASQAEAEAGTDNTKTMTPLRTKEAIDALVPSTINLYQLGALAAGDVVRLRNDTQLSVVSFEDPVTAVRVQTGFLQSGTIRATIEKVSGVGTVRVVKNNIVIASSTSNGVLTHDFSVVPGDTVKLEATTPGAGNMVVRNARLLTSGVDLWPGPGVFLGTLESNTP